MNATSNVGNTKFNWFGLFTPKPEPEIEPFVADDGEIIHGPMARHLRNMSYLKDLGKPVVESPKAAEAAPASTTEVPTSEGLTEEEKAAILASRAAGPGEQAVDAIRQVFNETTTEPNAARPDAGRVESPAAKHAGPKGGKK